MTNTISQLRINQFRVIIQNHFRTNEPDIWNSKEKDEIIEHQLQAVIGFFKKMKGEYSFNEHKLILEAILNEEEL